MARTLWPLYNSCSTRREPVLPVAPEISIVLSFVPERVGIGIGHFISHSLCLGKLPAAQSLRSKLACRLRPLKLGLSLIRYHQVDLKVGVLVAQKQTNQTQRRYDANQVVILACHNIFLL